MAEVDIVDRLNSLRGNYVGDGIQPAILRSELVETIVSLRAERDALARWAVACRDEVLYPLAQHENAMGAVADGLGQQLVNVLRKTA